VSTVIDSSVLVAALVDGGAAGTWAEEILTRGSLCAPELAYVESTNILRRLERAKTITSPEANAAQSDLMQLDMDVFSFEPFANRVWELRHNVTSYDAWYVALAEAINAPLATLDQHLAKADGVACRFLMPGEG
jgi:predicted nucleic acid-binding protein